MRRPFLALLLLLPFTGCFETDTLIRVRADGSGTIEQTIRMSKQTLAQMRALASEMGDAETFELMDVEKLEAQASRFGEGVRFVTAEPLADEHGEGYRAVYAFSDVTALRITSGSPDVDDGSASAEEPVTFAFEPGRPATLTIRQPDVPLPDSAEAAAQDTAIAAVAADSTAMAALGEQAAAIFEGMRMRMAVEPQGSIQETAATFRDGNRIVLFDVDMGALLEHPEKLAALQVTGARTPAEMQALLADIPGLRIEPQRSVTVVFE